MDSDEGSPTSSTTTTSSRNRESDVFRSISPHRLYDLLRDLVIPEEMLKENGFVYFDDEKTTRANYRKDKWNQRDFMPDNDNSRKCTRCSKIFNRLATTSFFSSKCQYHPQKITTRNGFPRYQCCGAVSGTSKGCIKNDFHVHRQPSESTLDQFVRTPKPVSLGDYRSRKVFALDIEMVHTVNGLEAARISLLNHRGQVMIDEFVKPEGRIVHLNTEYSGIRMEHVESARGLNEVRTEMFLYLNAQSILIGHGLCNDLKALRMVHLNVIDTAILFPFDDGKMPSLRSLAWHFLGERIHEEGAGGHCSVEDSTICLEVLERALEGKDGFRRDGIKTNQ